MRTSSKNADFVSREGRLFAYTMAAGAAAWSGSGQSADAAIEYFDIEDISIAQYASQSLYINGDTQTDIILKNYVFNYGNYQGALIPVVGGRIMAENVGVVAYPSALSAGEEISPSTINPNYWQGSLAYGAVNPLAEFVNVTDAYLGFSFADEGGPDLFYAWVRVDVNNATGTFVIKDFAFENTPNTGILAGATSSALQGDLDGDGFVGLADLDLILNNWNLSVPPADPAADPTGDNFIGLADLDEVLNNWNAGTPPTPAAVPEPGALSFLAAGAAGLTMWRRRK